MKKNNYLKISKSSISSVENLCLALDLTLGDFLNLKMMSGCERYVLNEKPKPGGGIRKTYNPNKLVRVFQRRINNRIFSNPHIIKWPAHIYGSIPNDMNSDGSTSRRDFVACASVHCGAKSILKVDVKDFFDNISKDIVYDIFHDFLKFNDEVSEALTDICTYDRSHLVQGALTSSYLATLALFNIEGGVVQRLALKKLKYTRFVDDITISSVNSRYDFDFAKSIVINMLHEKDLPVNLSKTKVYYSGSEPLTVHGLRVSFNQVRLPSDEVRKIRAAVKNIEIIANDTFYRKTGNYRKDFNKCMGRVNKLSRVGHKQHKNLVARLNKVYPLPSFTDIKKTRNLIEKIRSKYDDGKNYFYYHKMYYAAMEKLNLIKRSFPNTAKSLRLRLRGLRPEYD